MTEPGKHGGAGDSGIGARLLAARERAGMSLFKAADKMHVDPAVIQALESENFTQLGATVFVRGHLRHYAELVRESAPELLALYTASMTSGASPDLTLMPHARNDSSLRSALVTTGVALFIGVGLIGSVRWIYQDLHPAIAPVQQVAPVASTPAATDPVLAPQPLNSAAAPAVATALVTSPAASSAPPETAKPMTKAVRSRAAVADTSVTLRFKSACWTEVYDARGGQLYRAIGGEGAEARLHGAGPLKVMIGNLSAVDVEINDQVQTVPQAAQSGARAQFLVTRDGEIQPLSQASPTAPAAQRVATAGIKP